ncbi:uncharacterized protein LOC117289563 [Asterias rubens]|uniref:uncharacterized protein LOC117289563 n=1 Tax=Asterias rubens TaxID=7604 RepID=UPI001454F7D5|nr:uncharacterized protein LOC117289563 [Asterias rubens]
MDTMQDPANQSPGKIRSERGERPKIVGKKLSTLSVRDSDMDFNELTPDLKDTTSGQSSTSRFGMTNETAQNDNALKLRDNNSLDTQNPEVRPRSRMCCGGHPSKGDDAKTFQNIYPHSVEPSADDCNELSTTRSSPGDLADSSTAPKGNFQPNHQSQGLFNLLLQDTTEDELVLEGDLAAERVAMATSNTSGEDLTPSPPPANQPAPKKRRKASRKVCADPFAKLPKVKLRPTVWMEEDDDEWSYDRPRRGSKKSGKSPRLLSRQARRFEDPFKELAFVVFDSADVDSDKRLRRAEFTSVLKSPSLELELSAEDIRKLEKDCSGGRKDIKDLPVSFDEFLPLAKYLLMLFYNKEDSNSRNPWSILDRGKDSPPYYFNKHTGTVRSDRPVDYDNQPELFLFEDALRDAMETADMNKDGRINLNDFIRIINSEDFGLILTKRDISEISKHFKNEAGKVSNVCYSEFLPLAKRLIVAVFSARDPMTDDWTFLCTRHVGAFWFNKRTGQSLRHPPNHIVTMQQHQLKHRNDAAKVLLKTSEELKVTKEKLEKESALRTDFEEKYTTLSSENAFTCRELQKVTRLYEKSRAESEKKGIFLDAKDKEITKLKYKIEQLEERVAEAERTEANLESMRDVLRNCQGAVRDRELEIVDHQTKIEDLNKQLSECESRVDNGKAAIADLHQQLRYEGKRNERMELELKKLPPLQKELDEKKETLQVCEKRLEERNAVLILTRRVNGENKTKIKGLEAELAKLHATEKELDIAKCEIYTLKQLIVGKDSLVMQKSHELDTVKERLETDHGETWVDSENKSQGIGWRNGGPTNGTNFRIVRLQKRRPSKGIQVGAQSRRSKLTYNSTQLDVGTPPYDSSSSSGSQSDCKQPKLEDYQRLDTPESEGSLVTSLNTSNGSFLRLLHKQGSAEDGMPTIYDLYTPEGSYAPTSRSANPTLKNGTHLRPKSSMARLETEGASIMQKGTVMFEDDFLVAQCLRVGDRVRVKKKGGRRKGAILTGVVKFVGKVDKEFHHNDHRLYTGIRLDEAVGDTDGVIKGKRYFTANPRHGKLLPVTDVVSVLNPKTATYKRIAECIRTQRLETGTVKYEKDRNPHLIRVM